ncbi:hypothetical protein H5T55_04150 [Candidatus Bipolaricaulota bacterium]|nr:hypothetical protein [Candidatus Bipolaricaulota bacterium]
MADILALGENLVQSYVTWVAPIAGPLPAPPIVSVRNTPNLAYFDLRSNVIVVPYWPTLTDSQQAFFLSLTPSAEEAALLFGELFNWFLVAHEMTHWLQRALDLEADPYTRERIANECAVAFFMESEAAEERLVELDRMLAYALDALADPVPPGADPAAYFNLHYYALAQDPAKYGYFQFRFITDAVARRKSLRLVDLLFGQS